MKHLSMIGAAMILAAALSAAQADTVAQGWIINGSKASIRDCLRRGGKVVPSTSGLTHCFIYKH